MMRITVGLLCALLGLFVLTYATINKDLYLSLFGLGLILMGIFNKMEQKMAGWIIGITLISAGIIILALSLCKVAKLADEELERLMSELKETK